MRATSEANSRVLILTPAGRDGTMVCQMLEAAGLRCVICPHAESLLAALPDAGAAVIAQEALSHADLEALVAALDTQEPWSDIPILLLTLRGTGRAALADAPLALLERANVMFLQRPLWSQYLLSAVRSALRARQRQYEMRDLHRELAHAVQLGDLFMAILGHDLRMPLNAITLSAECIVQCARDERALGPAGRILASSLRMSRMIQQLLDFARARQGGGMALDLGRTSIRDVCRAVLQEVEDGNPMVSIRLTESGDLEGKWDADRLGQVFSNLVANAVQHGAEGKPVTVVLDGAQETVVWVRIINYGDLPADALPNLFDAFRRADTESKGGLGLGLFIAREIVRAHGGEIHVKTSKGLIHFEVELPRERSTEDSAPVSLLSGRPAR